MFGLSKPVVAGLAALLMVLALAAIVLLGVREIRSMVDEAAVRGKALSDAEWSAKVEKANAEANRRIADQASAVVEIQAAATDRVNAASQQLEELRKRNAALPDGNATGLSRDRVRMLPD
ncbi:MULTISPECIES: hypothetical protein [unclassified Rhizobium]|uniref:hypothetical protein n=1 Tax=unclassified Rhizobium TaxID=2613769 RepID=UPI00160B2397|nr:MULTISPECIES: hypothetical protein [unclassified Rhizobium]MBB3297913.1 hypothetical protein [Rhizobium sp. BK112]MBB4177592.1 hypothetical protein [Rhizobium sp. BK109]